MIPGIFNNVFFDIFLSAIILIFAGLTFIASQNPLYIGIILKPSHGAWIRMSRAKTVVLEMEGKPVEFSIPYRIEVGENSIFFLKPREDA